MSECVIHCWPNNCLIAAEHILRLYWWCDDCECQRQQKILRRERCATRPPITFTRRTMQDISFKVTHSHSFSHFQFLTSWITIFRYPAQLIQVDISGKRFDRQSAARKSLLHVQSGLHAIEDANDSSNTDSVKRRSRSRKPRGNRRNTIAGTDQKEIEGIAENGFVWLFQSVWFLEHGVSFATTLIPRRILMFAACENFADEILIAWVFYWLSWHKLHFEGSLNCRQQN